MFIMNPTKERRFWNLPRRLLLHKWKMDEALNLFKEDFFQRGAIRHKCKGNKEIKKNSIEW